MSTRVIDTSKTSAGTLYDLPGDGQTIRVLAGVELASTTGGGAFYLPGNGTTLIVEGTLRGAIPAQLGDDPADTGNLIRIGATGLSDATAYGLLLRGSGRIENAGRLEADDCGIYTFGNADRRIDIVNTGTIQGQWYGVFANVFYSDVNRADTHVTNQGSIGGQVASLRLGLGDDVVTNRGTLTGEVVLSSGNDLFDNLGGTLVNAPVNLGDGADTFRAGTGAETVSGGNGLDTLDFRSGSGVGVNLGWQVANTGRAAGDRYAQIEQVWGSATGADQLTGDGAANTLMGWGGNDQLAGGAGNDRLLGGDGADGLNGGAGKDDLTGGSGADRFVFASVAHGGDRILDFSRAGGDKIVIDASGFGGGLAETGSPSAAQFDPQGTNVAATAEVRFIFRTTDATLWFDSNGNGAGGLTLVADLQDGASVWATDILLV